MNSKRCENDVKRESLRLRRDLRAISNLECAGKVKQAGEGNRRLANGATNQSMKIFIDRTRADILLVSEKDGSQEIFRPFVTIVTNLNTRMICRFSVSFIPVKEANHV
jgi:sugar-specific transcriptional regulator TrmB